MGRARSRGRFKAKTSEQLMYELGKRQSVAVSEQFPETARTGVA
ncbi:hypothetical protein [Streptomyces gardneri]